MIALLLTAFATPAGAVGDISDTVNIRLPGGDNSPSRVALRFAEATFPDDGADRVLVATDAAFADALASGTLQGTDTPLLLTARDDLRADVASEIDRLGASQVTLLGGTAALTEDVADELESLGLDVDRLAGAERFSTAVEIARLAPESSTAIVSRGFAASGDDTQAFADALAAGAWAGENGWPTFLTQADHLSGPTRAAIAASDIAEVKLLGGPAAISDAVVDDLVALGITVERVFGPTRFDTAVEIAKRRGFDNAEDAERVILLEGQAEDAWAAGFAAAAHGAATSSPIVLANGEDLPPATVAYLEQTAFAVDEDNVDEPVLICAASAAACDQARALLGLPTEATITLDEPEDGVPSRETLTGIIDLHGFPAQVAVFGPCVTEGLAPLGPEGEIELVVRALPGACTLTFEIAFENGSIQTSQIPILVAPSLPKTGPVVDTETGGDAYTIVAEGDDAPRTISYTEDDAFSVDGQAATIGAFEAALTIADQVTFTADTSSGTVHDLLNVNPDEITVGTVGNVDLSAGSYAIIEPVSGVTLRPALAVPAESATVRIDGITADGAVLREDLSEGDTIDLSAEIPSFRNTSINGAVTDLDVDTISGLARFRAGVLGDDPLTAENQRFRARDNDVTQTFTVDGSAVDFAVFADALSEGDQVRYFRQDGIERFLLTNAAGAPVVGLVTETFDPDGSPVAPEPSDGGSITVLTDRGRQSVSYTADATFTIDGILATEAEFEVARTPGDRVEVQRGDAASQTTETVALSSRDLTGRLANIREGSDRYDVVTLAGTVYVDLDYTAAVFGGTDVYIVDGIDVGLSQFETELGSIDAGQVTATAVVRRNAAGNTEHRLTHDG